LVKRNIFKMGSCRTSISGYLDNFDCEYNYDLTHTTKEIIMYLDILDGKIDFKNMKYISCLMRHPNKFKLNTYRKMLNLSDIVIIEISSLKIVKSDDFYYQIVRYNEENKINNISNDFSIYLQTEDDFVRDIEEIYERIKKPIIFVPHITMDFKRDLNPGGTGENLQLENESLVKTRQTIEKYVVDNTKYNIKTSDLFSGYHYSEICDCSKKFDPNHYTKLGYKILSKKIEEMCIQISNDNI
jgi:hypothetical protein